MTEDKPRGAILQRDRKTYAIVPRTPVGLVTPDVLEAISSVVRKYNIPITKITSGQRLALVGIEKEEVDQIICWLTGYDEEGLKKQIEQENDFETFFSQAPAMQQNHSIFKGVIKP